jgi:site-specific DNA recombinase
MERLYKYVINIGYKEMTKTDKGDIKTITDKINAANNDISQARQKFVRDQLDHTDFKIIKKEKEELIEALEIELLKFTHDSVNISSELDQAITALYTIDSVFSTGDVKTRRYIIGSIYPGKLIFDGFQYRTPRVNEVAQAISALGAGFGENKNGQIDQNFDLSTLVPRRGIEPLIHP